MKKAAGKKAREPSRASLREIPEINFDKTKVRRNPYALRIAKEGVSIHDGSRHRTARGVTLTGVPARARCCRESSRRIARRA